MQCTAVKNNLKFNCCFKQYFKMASCQMCKILFLKNVLWRCALLDVARRLR
jgi:hypothetical protein